jgi:UDP-glucuronate 4-epimerase
MKTILVTGVAGFIGSNTAQRLLSENNRVIGIDNLNDYYNQNWKKENLEKLQENDNFSFHKIDIRDLESLKKAIQTEKIDAIIHLAARAGVRPSIADPVLYEEVNVKGTVNMLEIAKEFEIKQFVFASSSSVYGNQEKIPFSETDSVDNPISPYAATKKACELIAHSYSHLHGINTIGLRFFTVYGPAGRPDMAPYLFTKAILGDQAINKFGDGRSRRDYTFIDDIVSGVVAALDLDHPYEIINLGNNTPVSLNEFIATLEKITDKTMKINQMGMQPGDVDQTYADISKAQELLGYNPKTSFKEGLTKFVEWYKENRINSS